MPRHSIHRGRGLWPWVRAVVSGWQSTYPSSPWIFPASLNPQRLGHYQAAIGQDQNSLCVSSQKGGARDPGDSCPFLFLVGRVFAWGMGTNFQLGTGQEEDAWSPVEMTGKQLENRVVLSVSSGGQHTVLLVKDKEQS